MDQSSKDQGAYQIGLCVAKAVAAQDSGMRYTPLTQLVAFILLVVVTLTAFACHEGHTLSEVLAHPSVVVRNLM